MPAQCSSYNICTFVWWITETYNQLQSWLPKNVYKASIVVLYAFLHDYCLTLFAIITDNLENGVIDQNYSTRTCGPPTASSSWRHCSVVLESIHTGELATEKAEVNWVCRKLSGFRDMSNSSAPVCQQTVPCCWNKRIRSNNHI